MVPTMRWCMLSISLLCVQGLWADQRSDLKNAIKNENAATKNLVNAIMQENEFDVSDALEESPKPNINIITNIGTPLDMAIRARQEFNKEKFDRIIHLLKVAGARKANEINLELKRVASEAAAVRKAPIATKEVRAYKTKVRTKDWLVVVVTADIPPRIASKIKLKTSTDKLLVPKSGASFVHVYKNSASDPEKTEPDITSQDLGAISTDQQIEISDKEITFVSKAQADAREPQAKIALTEIKKAYKTTKRDKKWYVRVKSVKGNVLSGSGFYKNTNLPARKLKIESGKPHTIEVFTKSGTKPADDAAADFSVTNFVIANPTTGVLEIGEDAASIKWLEGAGNEPKGEPIRAYKVDSRKTEWTVSTESGGTPLSELSFKKNTAYMLGSLLVTPGVPTKITVTIPNMQPQESWVTVTDPVGTKNLEIMADGRVEVRENKSGEPK